MGKQFSKWIHRVKNCKECPFYREEEYLRSLCFVCLHPDEEVRPKTKLASPEQSRCRDKDCPLNDGPITVDKEDG